MCYHTKIKEAQPGLLAFVKSRIFNLHDAQDIVQNVNLILINKKDEYDKNKNFKSWAFRIADFQIKGYLTKRQRCKTILSPMEDNDLMGLALNAAKGVENVKLTHNNCPASILEKGEKIKKLHKRMFLKKKLLSKNQLKVIDLYSKGLKYKEIAKTLNISISKVSVTKIRAIKRMKI